MAIEGEEITIFDRETRIRLSDAMLRCLDQRELAERVEKRFANDFSQLPSPKEVVTLGKAMPEREDGETTGEWLRRGFAALSQD